jgi:hypothetical protein
MRSCYRVITQEFRSNVLVSAALVLGGGGSGSGGAVLELKQYRGGVCIWHGAIDKSLANDAQIILALQSSQTQTHVEGNDSQSQHRHM